MFIVLVRNKLRAFLYALLVFWLLLVTGAEYHLAYTPGYDSFAPALSIVAGWIPAAVYSAIWLAIMLMIRYVTRSPE